MALVLRTVVPGQTSQTLRLKKGQNKIRAERGARYEVVDEATGQVVPDALIERAGDRLVVRVPSADVTVAIDDFHAPGQAAELAMGGGAPSVTSSAAPVGGADGGASGGQGTLFAVLGSVAAVGAAAAVAGGGGNQSGGGTPRDTTAPGAPTGLALAAADDSGASSSDRITRTTSNLTITGTAEPGATVELLNGSTRLGQAVASSTGAFSIDISLAEGVTNVTARATDAAGNVGPVSTALAITVDTTAPAAPTGLVLAAADDTGSSTSDGVTTQASALTISGTAEANAQVELFNGTTSLGTTTAGANGAFSLDVTLPAGAANITARATDAAGNVSAASTALAITVDTTAPAAPAGLALAAADDTGSSTGDGVTNQASALTISGTAEANARVELFNGTTSLGTTTAGANGAFSLDVTLPAGAASLTALTLAPIGFAANGANPAFVAGGIFADSYAVQDLVAGATAMTVINSNGDRGNDVITGNDAANTLTGGAGADTLTGGAGADLLIGGLNTGFGSQPGDGADLLYGGVGDDTLRGGDGDDQLFGEDGNDNLRADAGSDLIDGGAGADFVSYVFSAAAAGITFDMRAFVPGVEFMIADPLGGTDTLRGIETIGIVGTNFDDVIYGSPAAVNSLTGFANQLGGGAGNDQIVGGNAVDRIDGGAGSDTLDGGGDSDVFAYDFSLATAAVTFDLRGFASGGQAQTIADPLGGTDTLSNLERAFVRGTGFDDVIYGVADAVATATGYANELRGEAGNDQLFGGASGDLLVGGAGRDTLTGGAGADIFVLDSGAGTSLSLADLVTDFAVGEDKLSLPTGTTFADLVIAQGTGANANDTIIATSSGTFLAVLQNVQANQVTSASFVI